ncbi:MAG: glycosyltransferase family 39 protein [Desulfuromonadaceae bacterium]|nr:glycosyltransferase family 39 protein [Desulfuromonadaceae bacterium]MDD2854583.1 glycosyltransferase family 39 protein [Desulfuromonadaceae bacterium]
MSLLKKLWFPFLIIAIPGIIISLLLPYFPVDETRYLSVAWEMNLYDSYIVPIQNALPYSHKPPLLFWLFNLDWAVFGVNGLTLRFIPILFSLLNVSLIYKISLLLWNDEKTAAYASVIISSTFSYLLWSALIMFDIVLTFWILLSLFGLLSAAKNSALKYWVLVGIAFGGGILTKGPVIFVYTLPVSLLAFLWIPEQKFVKKWYAWLTLSVFIGLAVVLVWLIPAAMTGGKAYREAILWGQTVNRVANSFAHQRPFWWYLPWLALLLLPWILIPSSWRDRSRKEYDGGRRFIMLWAGSSLVLLSLISGKQVHYLIPLMPAFALLFARNISMAASDENRAVLRNPIAMFYALLGIAVFILPFIKPIPFIANIGIPVTRWLSAGLLAIGLSLFFVRSHSVTRLIYSTALSSLALLVMILCGGSTFFHKYDVTDISQRLKEKQEDGYTILHYGKYHGQYQFIGRLTRPLLELHTKSEITGYAAEYEKVALITYEPSDEVVNKEDIYFQYPFRNKKVILWNKSGIGNLKLVDPIYPIQPE